MKKKETFVSFVVDSTNNNQQKICVPLEKSEDPPKRSSLMITAEYFKICCLHELLGESVMKRIRKHAPKVTTM